MAVPYMASTMKGWTKKYTVKIVSQSVANHRTVRTETETVMRLNKQPMPPAEVNRKPEEQRTWKWWSIIVVEGQVLQTDDVIVIDGQQFRVETANDWTESGFQKYGVIEDYTNA